jgi:hypothetical protein
MKVHDTFPRGTLTNGGRGATSHLSPLLHLRYTIFQWKQLFAGLDFFLQSSGRGQHPTVRGLQQPRGWGPSEAVGLKCQHFFSNASASTASRGLLSTSPFAVPNKGELN